MVICIILRLFILVTKFHPSKSKETVLKTIMHDSGSHALFMVLANLSLSFILTVYKRSIINVHSEERGMSEALGTRNLFIY